MRLLLAPLLVIVACLLAGIYGMAHDQLSYTLSPDYFHHFKFIQFGLQDSYLHPRIDAAIVGWNATWWMGLIIGTPLALIGLIVPGVSTYAWTVGKSFMLAIMTAVIVGLMGLAIALPLPIADLYTPTASFLQGVTDREAFLEVGMMHNASYLGGGLGLLVAIGYLLRAGSKARKTARTTAQQASHTRL